MAMPPVDKNKLNAKKTKEFVDQFFAALAKDIATNASRKKEDTDAIASKLALPYLLAKGGVSSLRKGGRISKGDHQVYKVAAAQAGQIALVICGNNQSAEQAMATITAINNDTQNAHQSLKIIVNTRLKTIPEGMTNTKAGAGLASFAKYLHTYRNDYESPMYAQAEANRRFLRMTAVAASEFETKLDNNKFNELLSKVEQNTGMKAGTLQTEINRMREQERAQNKRAAQQRHVKQKPNDMRALITEEQRQQMGIKSIKRGTDARFQTKQETDQDQTTINRPNAASMKGPLNNTQQQSAYMAKGPEHRRPIDSDASVAEKARLQIEMMKLEQLKQEKLREQQNQQNRNNNPNMKQGFV